MSRAEYMAEYRKRKKENIFQDKRYKNKGIVDHCLNCGTELGERIRFNKPRKFCHNDKCQHDYMRKQAIENGVAGAGSTKRYIAESRGYKCEACGISEWQNKKISLELDHIDGNSNNNDISNVRLLCPNCHSQTETYKARNTGKGRGKIGYVPKPFYLKK